MISKRLQEILERVSCIHLADIGCDHAYAACHALKEGKAKKAYACDAAEGPLNNAKKTIASMNLEGKVIPILSNGLEHVPADFDQLLIAGMGGKLIESILEKGMDKLDGVSLLLSPHKDAPSLRAFLQKEGFAIERECYLKDGAHDYPLIEAKKGSQTLSQSELLLGKNVLPNEEYLHFLEKELKKREAILEKAGPAKAQEAEAEANLIQKAIGTFKK